MNDYTDKAVNVGINDLCFLSLTATQEVANERDTRHQIEKRDTAMRGARRYAGRKV